jgi:hypothetical protein
MKAQTVANVVSIFVPNLLHHNNVGITYLRTSKFGMELVKFIPLYFVAMPLSVVIVTKVSFVTTLAHIVIGVKSKPQTPREIKLINVHTKMPNEVDKIFARQPLDPRGGGSDPPRLLRPPRPLRYF